jgi:pimeloyl-ACP methyl ester carboxylesterase
MLDIGEAAIAVRRQAGAAPGLFWLGGYRSDMRGTKAEALAGWAKEQGLAFTRFDYSGHGESGGSYAEGTISRWLNEAETVFERRAEGPQVLVGSSMGAWIALRLLQTLGGERSRVKGLLLIAPAPDFTNDLIEPGLTDEERRDLEAKGRVERPTPYGPEPDIFTRELIEDGRRNRVLTGPLDTFCPVHILQGTADKDVPASHALKLAAHLPKDELTLTLVPGGDHRLSRPEDISLLLRTAESLVELAKAES